MDKRRITNILLAALLCYGQLVASVHLVGHLHDETCLGARDFATNTCDTAHLGHNHQTAANQLKSGHAVSDYAAVDRNRNQDSDCAIYHALLNLSGTECAKIAVNDHQLANLSSHYSTLAVTAESLYGQSIRAPPNHS